MGLSTVETANGSLCFRISSFRFSVFRCVFVVMTECNSQIVQPTVVRYAGSCFKKLLFKEFKAQSSSQAMRYWSVYQNVTQHAGKGQRTRNKNFGNRRLISKIAISTRSEMKERSECDLGEVYRL